MQERYRRVRRNRNLRKKYSFSPADAGVPSADRHRRHPLRIPHPHGATPGDLRSHQPMNSSLLGQKNKNRSRSRRALCRVTPKKPTAVSVSGYEPAKRPRRRAGNQLIIQPPKSATMSSDEESVGSNASEEEVTDLSNR